MSFARGLDRSKADTFVGMYVNEWTQDYGRGRAAVRTLLDRGVAAGIITRAVTVEFVDDQGVAIKPAIERCRGHSPNVRTRVRQRAVQNVSPLDGDAPPCTRWSRQRASAAERQNALCRRATDDHRRKKPGVIPPKEARMPRDEEVESP